MNFFEKQDEARRKTGYLFFLFLLSVVTLCFAPYFFVSIYIKIQNGPYAPQLSPYLPLYCAGATFLLIVCGSLYKYYKLRSGGQAIALGLGAKPLLQPRTKEERRLINVVEEMSIAAGTPRPKVFILEHEMGINAFAAGYSIHDAVIGITQGAIEQLSRDELQGVIAHEFSHIFHGDMRINLNLVTTLHGILVIALLGETLLRSSSRSRSGRKNGGGAAGLGLVLLVVGYAGYFFASLIRAAVSRQREYLADASAVQYTRNPGGIRGALEKIGGMATHQRDLSNAKRKEISHMLFFDTSGWFATHPPLEKRIRAIDPNFNSNSQLLNQRNLSHSHSAFGDVPSSQIGFAQGFVTANQSSLKRMRSGFEGVSETLLGIFSGKSGHTLQERLALIELCLPEISYLSRNEYSAIKEQIKATIKSDGTLSVFEELLFILIDHSYQLSNDIYVNRKISIRKLKSLEPAISSLLSYMVQKSGSLAEKNQRTFQAAYHLLFSKEKKEILVPITSQRLSASLKTLNRASAPLKSRVLSSLIYAAKSDGNVNSDEETIIRIVSLLLDAPLPPNSI